MSNKEKFNKKLLVEGNDDKHVIWALCKHFNINETFDVIDCEGIDKLLEQIPVRLKQSGVDTIGIIIDADANLLLRWNSLKNLFISNFNISSMNYKSFLIFIVCFVISGEILLRITDHFKILEGNRLQKISIALDPSRELDQYKAKQIDLSDSSLRILVIGDSYIHGGGIAPEKKMSNQLKSLIIQHENNFKNIYVLDVSKPDANNLDNSRAYFSYKDFDPQIVVLGYHFNDINGNLDDVSNIDSLQDPNIILKTSSGSQNNMLIQKVIDFLYNMAILEYIMPKIQNFMLSKGYIIPKSRLDNTLKYYERNHETWKKSKECLSKMIADIKENESSLIVYHFAYTNLIEYPNLFERSSTSIEQFFKSHEHVTYISGIEQFKGGKASDYFIYKHDGHPNAKAHELIAKKIDETINNMKLFDTVAN